MTSRLFVLSASSLFFVCDVLQKVWSSVLPLRRLWTPVDFFSASSACCFCDILYLIQSDASSLFKSCPKIQYTPQSDCNCSDFCKESNGIFVLGWFFFLQRNFDFLNSHFWRNFFISFKKYCCPELKFENIFYLWSFFVKLWEFKDCHFGQFGTINARYISRD